MFGDERFKRYGSSEPGMFSDFVCREACQCDSKQDIISGKEWYTARIWNAIRIRFRERYVGDKIVKIRRRWVPPKLFGVQNVAYRRRVRLQYASNTPQYPIHPQYVGVIVLNGFYCSSNYLQSDRHTIYIEAIFVIVPVVFEHCFVHTNQFPFHLCRLVLFQPSAA